MTDHHPPNPPSTGPTSLFGGGPSAIVAFALAVLVLTGNNLMVASAQSFFGTLFTGAPDFPTFFAVWALGGLVPAAAAVLVARRAITVGTIGWELHVGRAALALAAVALAYTVLLLIGGAVHMG